MQLVFRPDDLEAYAAVRERLGLHIVAWARRHGQQVEPALVAAALDQKHGVDGRLGHWTTAHVADALTVRFPRTVTLPPEERDTIPAALDAVLGFLADHEWFDTRSDAAAELHAQVSASTPALHAALDDERNHDLGTFWAAQMLRHGVATADAAAVARFLRRAGNGELNIDRAALAAITSRETRAVPAPPPRPLPPVLLPGAAALLAAAEAAPALTRLRAFTRWVRAGRPLTRDGRLPIVDACAAADALDLDRFSREHARTDEYLPEITLLLSWARQARFVRVVRGRLVQVRSSAQQLSRPLEMWRRAFEAVGNIGEHFGGSDVFGAPSLFGMSLGEAYPILLRQLYVAGGDPVALERFHRAVRDAVNERLGCVVDDLAGDVEQRLWRRDVAALIDALELLGAVRLEESLDGDDQAELAALSGRDDPDPTLVALTPLGLWAVREMFLDAGVDAPLVGASARQDIEELCVACVGLRRDVAHAELAAWVAARPGRPAARELLHYLRRAEHPAHREFALFALALSATAPTPARMSDRADDRSAAVVLDTAPA